MEEHNMAIYTLLENDNIALTIPLSGCSENLDREELKENLIETMKNFHSPLGWIQVGYPQAMMTQRGEMTIFTQPCFGQNQLVEDIII